MINSTMQKHLLLDALDVIKKSFFAFSDTRQQDTQVQ